jgi:hypothetical protein
MTRDPKKFREIARVCAVLSKSAVTPKSAILSQLWPRLGEIRHSTESFRALLDRDPVSDADDLSRFDNNGGGVGL